MGRDLQLRPRKPLILRSGGVEGSLWHTPLYLLAQGLGCLVVPFVPAGNSEADDVDVAAIVPDLEL